MSVASLSPSLALFREEQLFPIGLYGLIAFVGALGLYGAPLVHLNGERALALGALSATVVVAWQFLKLTTVVTAGEVRLWYGWWPLARRTAPLTGIVSAQAVEYRPWRDHWGWGPTRRRDGERVFTARGRKGVRVVFADGQRWLIGSQRPEDLARALLAERPP